MVQSLVSISRTLCKDVEALVAEDRATGQPVAPFIYNPLVYAREPHETYLTKYGVRPKQVLLVGMNPGPFGMAQTGVPFGDVSMVRDFLQVDGRVERPLGEHPSRPVNGFSCRRKEVSGTRLWGFAHEKFGSAEQFFSRFFVVNYCPLVFMEQSGRNLTPDKLPKKFKDQLEAACDRALRQTALVLRPSWVLGVGAFAEKRAKIALSGLEISVGSILHPSPASPAANRGWSGAVEKQLTELGIDL